MPKSCKIDRLGYAEIVQQLMADGVNTRQAMAECLNNDYGLDVSEATVGRYMARIRSAAQDQAFQTITEHVNRTVPDDLDALEEMEKICLDWSRQAGRDRAERLAEAAENIAGEIDAWHDLIIQSEDPKKATKQIIKKALALIAMDDRRQEQRLSAMRQVHKIIETKLSKAGLLDDDQKGRIVFMQQQYRDDQPATKGKNTLRLVGDGEDG